jgi:hypothetical protein
MITEKPACYDGVYTPNSQAKSPNSTDLHKKDGSA